MSADRDWPDEFESTLAEASASPAFKGAYDRALRRSGAPVWRSGKYRAGRGSRMWAWLVGRKAGRT